MNEVPSNPVQTDVDQDAAVRRPPSAVTVIQPTRGWRSLGLQEVWEYRELLYFITAREIKSRYRQMALGPLWILLTPVVKMAVFVILARLTNIGSDGLPRPLFYYAAMLPWTLFAVATTQSATSLVKNIGLISKVYFPRLIIPIAAAIVGLVDFAIGFVLLLIVSLLYGIVPGTAIVMIVPMIVMAEVAALAVGLWLATLSVKFRDVRFGIDHLLQVWMFASVILPSSSIPAAWRWVYRLNPMVHAIDGFRWAMFRTHPSFNGAAPDWTTFLASVVFFALMLAGAYQFRRTERTIVDYI